MATVSPTDSWAVGTALEETVSGGTHSIGLIEHFDGKQWSMGPQFSGVNLLAIRAVSANDIFAVGGSNVDAGQPNPFLAHFNGTTWSQVALPSLPNRETGLVRGIAVISANDIWIAGDAGTVVPTTLFAMHFNGTRWSVIPVPVPAGGHVHDLGFGRGMTAIATNNVWAVGNFAPSTSPAVEQTLTEHFNGTSWKIVPSANAGNPGSSNTLSGVAAVSANSVWACGQTNDSQRGPQNLIEHFDGIRWTVSPVPPGNGFAGLFAMLAFPSGSVFAAGGDLGAGDALISVIFHTSQGK